MADMHIMLDRGGPWLRPIAHRGLHDRERPENSMAAFAAAIAHGYGIECDVQPSRDGAVMVFHDESLARMTGRQAQINSLSQDELAGLRLLDTDEGIPTLAQMLELVNGQVPLLIEMKDQSGDLSAGHDALAQALVDGLADYDGPMALMSFNPSLVAAAHRLRPDLPVGLVTCGFSWADWPDVPAARRAHLRAIADFDSSGASFVSHDRRDLGNPALAALRARGVPIASWTIRSAEAAQQAYAQGADLITFEGFHP